MLVTGVWFLATLVKVPRARNNLGFVPTVSLGWKISFAFNRKRFVVPKSKLRKKAAKKQRKRSGKAGEIKAQRKRIAEMEGWWGELKEHEKRLRVEAIEEGMKGEPE